MLRIALNGFGRIGRCVVRSLLERELTERFELVAINDLADPATLAHLLRFDSTHGRLKARVETDGQHITIGSQQSLLLAEKDPANLPWSRLGVDVVLECTGRFKSRALLEGHLQAGAGRVITSHPVPDADSTVVFGVNQQDLDEGKHIISPGSCTTNCLVPLLKVLHDSFGFEHGMMTTVHAYTADQNLVDGAHRDPRRARAAAVSMIPTSTGAAKTVAQVLPELKGKLDATAIRVPVLNVSLVDLNCVLGQAPSVETIHKAIQSAADGPLRGILEVNDLPLVSCDFNHNPASCVLDASQTRVIGHQARLMAWYDNEWGFSNRMVDMLEYLAAARG